MSYIRTRAGLGAIKTFSESPGPAAPGRPAGRPAYTAVPAPIVRPAYAPTPAVPIKPVLDTYGISPVTVTPRPVSATYAPPPGVAWFPVPIAPDIKPASAAPVVTPSASPTVRPVTWTGAAAGGAPSGPKMDASSDAALDEIEGALTAATMTPSAAEFTPAGAPAQSKKWVYIAGGGAALAALWYLTRKRK